MKSDIADAARIAISILVSWIFPERSWARIAAGISGPISWLRRAQHRTAADHISLISGDHAISVPTRSLPRQHIKYYLLECMYHARCHRPGRWRPRVSLRHGERIDRALQEGKGAILWVTDFMFYPLMTKMALSQAGYAAMHLSRPGHPFSHSWFGEHLLNPLVVSLELRYIETRVTIDEANTAASMRALLRHLKANGIVTVTVGDEARQTRLVRFLDGRLPMATGVPKLALVSGAPILPVFTVYRADGAFDVTIGSPLEFSREGPAEDAVLQAMQEYVETFESYVRRYPYLWREWAAAVEPT